MEKGKQVRAEEESGGDSQSGKQFWHRKAQLLEA